MVNTLDRFWNKVDNSGECWLWTAYRDKDGYGHFAVRKGLVMLAHRFAYEHQVGQIPEGLELDHLCRVTSCVRPDHLEPVTHAENMRRGVGGINSSSKTHCPQGHPYDETNTYINVSEGQRRRRCRKCAVRHSMAYQARVQAQ